MYRRAPDLETRAAAEIRDQVRDRIALEFGVSPSQSDPPVDALVHVFGHYWHIVASRLNQALDKNFVTFLDYLGVSPISASAAVVPLTFMPVQGAPAGVTVPSYTQVAAAAADGEPVVFETVRPLPVSGAALRHFFSLDPTSNARTDLSSVVDAVASAPVPVMAAAEPSPHVLLLGDDTIFALQHVTSLTVELEIAAPPSPVAMRTSLEWFMPGPEEIAVIPSIDTTDGLRRSGDVVFSPVAEWPDPVERQGKRSRWLGCRIVATNAGNWTAYAPRIELRAEVKRAHVTLDAAFADTADVDLSKDFYPFGTRPTFGSTLYLASDDVFSRPGAKVSLDVVLTNPHNAADEPPIRRVYTDGHPRVWWEYWNGTRWVRLDVDDTTKAFRLSGRIDFDVPRDFTGTVVRGREGRWVRARLASGHYGEDDRWEPVDPAQPAAGFNFRPATLAPPSIQVLAASVALIVTRVPDIVITLNEGVYEDVSAGAHSGLPVPVFTFPCGPKPALYLGILPRDERKTLEEPFELFVLSEPPGVPASRSDEDLGGVVVDWQVWDGAAWDDLEVGDETLGFTRTGTVTLVAPPNAAPRRNFVEALPLFWFRALPRDRATWRPALRAMLRNTVLAVHRSTFVNEVLGSSHAAPRQTYAVLHPPVLEGEVLQVREPALSSVAYVPSAAYDEEPDPNIDGAVWVRWRAADDLLSSAPDDRHYVIDRERGTIAFGDARHGRIPPAGSNNVRLRRYESGGGAHGNVAAGVLNQLRTAVPYIAGVTNRVAGAGGADLEAMDRVRQRGATPLRHRQRAVTSEDYEDLALLASARVARAECVPLIDLSLEPITRRSQPGMVSVIIVPDSTAACPSPDLELLRQVRTHLDRARNAATELVVVGPDYVQIDVDVEVVVDDAAVAGETGRSLRLLIEAFLHPLTGGLRGEGWRLGELPDRNGLYALCASAAGVTWISALRVLHREDRFGTLSARQFLACSGNHRVVVSYTRGVAFGESGLSECR